jgi:pentatricopeptide repeat protein
VYAKCGTMVDAHKVFDQMHEQNACSWTVMIVACTRDGLPEEALALFHQMSRTSLQPNHFTFAIVLPSCTNSASLWKGMEIHTKIIKYGFESDLVVANALIDMYAKCGSIENACELFDKMLQRDVYGSSR